MLSKRCYMHGTNWDCSIFQFIQLLFVYWQKHDSRHIGMSTCQRYVTWSTYIFTHEKWQRCIRDINNRRPISHGSRSFYSCWFVVKMSTYLKTKDRKIFTKIWYVCTTIWSTVSIPMGRVRQDPDTNDRKLPQKRFTGLHKLWESSECIDWYVLHLI